MGDIQKEHEENMYIVISELISEKRVAEDNYNRACYALAICNQMLNDKSDKLEELEERIENTKKLLLKTELRPGSMFVALFEALCGERK